MDRVVGSQEPFPTGWYSIDLQKYRPCDSTYCLYPYDSIPPIAKPDETLTWLGPLATSTDAMMEVHRNAPEARGEVAAIVEQAKQLGLTVPESFERLMSSPELQDRIPSCTACYFQLGNHLVPCPGSDGGYIVSFLRDQQDVLLWYLYLTPQGTQRVLVSPIDLEELADGDAAEREKWNDAVRQNTFVCGPTFADFIYRFWLENTLWFDLDKSDATLSEAERTYIAHYTNTNGNLH